MKYTVLHFRNNHIPHNHNRNPRLLLHVHYKPNRNHKHSRSNHKGHTGIIHPLIPFRLLYLYLPYHKQV
jgi:hypothetical protein